jgi:hypothetical protein
MKVCIDSETKRHKQYTKNNSKVCVSCNKQKSAWIVCEHVLSSARYASCMFDVASCNFPPPQQHDC